MCKENSLWMVMDISFKMGSKMVGGDWGNRGSPTQGQHPRAAGLWAWCGQSVSFFKRSQKS